MTAFDTRFKARAFPRLLEQFGEAVVYRPKNGPARTIQAIVNRDPPVQAQEFTTATADQFVVEVLADEINGIGIREINTGGDQVDIAKRKGLTPVTMSVQKLLSQDGGVVQIEVR